MLKAKVWLVTKRVRCLDFPHNSHVLDSNTVATVFIKARLNGCDVACAQGNVRVLLSSADANGTFVDVQIRTDTVAGTVAVIEALLLPGVLVRVQKPFFIRDYRDIRRTQRN